MTLQDLPAVNATLNATSAVLLVLGFVFIQRREITRHKICMTGAFFVSVAFLVSYVVYHANHGSTPFTGQGWIRPVYFAILVSHVVLAAAVPPLAIVTLRRAWAEDYPRHTRIAVVTWPIWMYVSVTGVVVYWLLYHAYPPGTVG
jgi:putative membrane protein